MSLAARGQNPLGSEDKETDSSSASRPPASEDVSTAEEASEEFYTDSEETSRNGDGGSRSEELSSDEKVGGNGPNGEVKRYGGVDLRKATTGIQRSGPDAKSTTVVPAVIAGRKSRASVDSSEAESSSADAHPKHHTASTVSESEETTEGSSTEEAPTKNVRPKTTAAKKNGSTSADEDSTSSEQSTSEEQQAKPIAAQDAQKSGAQGNPSSVSKRHSWNPFAAKQVMTAQLLDTKIQKHLDRAGDADRRSKAANLRRTQDHGIIHNADAPLGSRVAAFFSRMGNWSREKRASREATSENKKASRHQKERTRLFSTNNVAPSTSTGGPGMKPLG